MGVATRSRRDPNNPDRTLPIDIWYPADGTHAGQDHDPAQLADHPFAQPHHAVPGATPAAGSYPLIAFSHGNSGLRRQSTFLTTHLASWGFMVVAPDHTGNTFPEMQGIDEEQRKAIHLAARAARPGDLTTAIDAAIDDPEVPRVDATRIGALGHSFGGWTAMKMARQDDRVRAVCGLAPAAEPFVGRKAFEPDELPLDRGTPALIIAGVEDVLVEIDASILSVYERLVAPRAVVGITGADHFHFCDGIELLHSVHQQTEREGLERPVRPYAELLDEATTHAVLRTLVLRYFDMALRQGLSDPCSPFERGEAWNGDEVVSLARGTV